MLQPKGDFVDNGKAHVPMYAEGNSYWDSFLHLLDFLQVLYVTPRNASILGGVWAFCFMLSKIIPNAWGSVYRAHVVPAIMVIMCLTAVWLPGLRPEIESIGWRIALGFTLSMFCWFLPIFAMWAINRWLPPKLARAIKKVMI